jgi:UDP-glucose 4-epimerase
VPTGYIASHTWLALSEAGFDVIGIDNFANSSAEVLNRLKALGGSEPEFVEADVRDKAALERVFDRRPIDAVVHFRSAEGGRREHCEAARLLSPTTSAACCRSAR